MRNYVSICLDLCKRAFVFLSLSAGNSNRCQELSIDFLISLQVNPGSKAEKSGIREGDIITEINGISITTQNLEEAKQLQKCSDNGLSLKLVQKASSNKKGKSSDSEGM